MLLVACPAMANAQEDPISAFLIKWENSKNYLLEMANEMPEVWYGYKPTEREMSFKEQLLHIKQNMDWLGSTYMKAEKQEEKTEFKRKKEVIEALRHSFDVVGEAIKQLDPEMLKEEVDFFAGPKTRLQILNLLQDHVTHHRGQLIVYMNLNHMEPPKYVGW